MRQTSTDTRARIVSAAYELFYAKGFARVSMDDIAQAAGIAKRTLYAYFPSKDDLGGAAAEQHQTQALDQIGSWCAHLEQDAGAGLAALFDELEAWATAPRWTGSGYTRVAMELADLPGHPVRRAAAAHKQAVHDALAKALGDREAALHLMIILEGAMNLQLVNRQASPLQAARKLALQLADGWARRSP